MSLRWIILNRISRPQIFSSFHNPALIRPQYIQDTEVQLPAFEPFLLLGLLANYNQFEFRNPYRLRLEDFVNETTIQKIVRGLGRVCSQSRNHYVSPQEDINERWTLSSALTYIGLGILAPSKVVSTAPGNEDAKEFAALYVLNHDVDSNSYVTQT